MNAYRRELMFIKISLNVQYGWRTVRHHGPEFYVNAYRDIRHYQEILRHIAEHGTLTIDGECI